MLFEKYLDAGLCVIPLRNGQPQIQWGKYMSELPPLDEVQKWGKYNEYALVCGAVSGVVALDIDTDDAAIIAKVEAIAGVSPVKKKGSKGFTAFYRYNGEKTQQWGKVVEILSNKHLTTIPPSKHRIKDLNYTWIDGVELIGADLPMLADNFIAIMDLLYPKASNGYLPRIEYTERTIEIEQARKMLDYISPDCDRDTWIRMGMALRDEFGDLACNLWHEWSSGSQKYKQGDAQSVWRSFHGHGIGIGTLVMEAQSRGFHFDVTVNSKIDADLSYLYKKEAVAVKATELEPHGLVGELANWITRTAWKPQPLLSLSAALVLFGFMKGRKYITETGVHSNIYVFNIAGSACGKDRPQSAIKFIMSRLQSTQKLLHAPASGTGFIDGLFDADGHGLAVIDEMAEYIAGTNNKNAGAHQQKVLKYWLEAFTSCGTYLDGEKRANGSKEAPKRIDKPMFCLLGSTTPDSLAASLRGKDIGNGLLNRFLFVQTMDSPRKRKPRDFNMSEPPPETVLQQFKKYLEPVASNIYGTEAEQERVKFSNDAAALYDEIDDLFEDAVQKLDIGDRLRNLYGRAHEYVGKVALIMSDDKEINKRDVQFAYDFVSMSLSTALGFCDDITDTREEEDFVRVKNVIKKAGSIAANDLTRAVRFPQGGSRRRAEILNDLLEIGIVEATIERTKGRDKTIYHFRG